MQLFKTSYIKTLQNKVQNSITSSIYGWVISSGRAAWCLVLEVAQYQLV